LIAGNVNTKELVVYGVIHGDIDVQSVEIKASGKITGEIKTQILSVENGAVYNGRLSMSPRTEAPRLNGALKREQNIVEVA
jgi:cytoskeletal protein CcmA (bactofilin family)